MNRDFSQSSSRSLNICPSCNFPRGMNPRCRQCQRYLKEEASEEERERARKIRSRYRGYMFIAVLVGVILAPFTLGISFIVCFVVILILNAHLEWLILTPEQRQIFKEEIKSIPQSWQERKKAQERELEERIKSIPELRQRRIELGTGCPNCGAKIEPTARFCPDCGYELIKVCPNCHQPVKEGQKFCANCGTKLTTQSTPSNQ